MDKQFYTKRTRWAAAVTICVIGIIILFAIFYKTCDSFILPYGFIGKATVIYIPPDGPDTTNAINKNRVFHIPATGLLVTSCSPRKNFANREFYYQAKNGNEIPLNQDASNRRFYAMNDSILVNVEGFSESDTRTYGNKAIAFHFEVIKLK